MARIIKDYTDAPAQETAQRWMIASDPEEVVLALDKNEIVAIRNAVQANRRACTSHTPPTSLNGSGGRVFEALDRIVQANGWS